jgi:hypothetical protein
VSAAARWSYTAKATVWAKTGFDDWTGVETYGAPQTIDCDYSAESKVVTDPNGEEFTTRQIIFTEADFVKRGDMILIGESAEANPVTAGAFAVRAVYRYSDTLDRAADDFKVLT